jgi:nuclease HARBI1
LNPICRPGKWQKECYSGHKRTHGLKYQSIVVPNGLMANLYGPIPGRRHDSHMLNESDVLTSWHHKMSRLNPPHYCFYGDSGYPLEQNLITPYFGNRISQSEHEFNEVMSKLRVCVEWEFGKLVNEFAFIDFPKNQKLLLQPVAKQFFVSAILKNCHTCLYGCQTSSYFNLIPPTLENYLSNTEPSI